MQLPRDGEGDDDFSISMIDNISITGLLSDNLYSKCSVNVNNLIKESLLKQNWMFESPVVCCIASLASLVLLSQQNHLLLMTISILSFHTIRIYNYN